MMKMVTGSKMLSWYDAEDEKEIIAQIKIVKADSGVFKGTICCPLVFIHTINIFRVRNGKLASPSPMPGVFRIPFFLNISLRTCEVPINRSNHWEQLKKRFSASDIASDRADKTAGGILGKSLRVALFCTQVKAEAGLILMKRMLVEPF